MKKLMLSLLIGLVVLVPAAVVFAHERAISTTTFYACEAPATVGGITKGSVDAFTVTQDDTLNCSGDVNYTSRVSWSVQGPQGVPGLNGTNGTNGTNGAPGPKGDTGPAGVPFTHPACTEVLTGREQQENMIFCVSGFPDGGSLWKAAIACADVAVMVGTPISDNPSADWGGASLPHYVQFGNGIHAEAHADGIYRFYSGNHQVC